MNRSNEGRGAPFNGDEKQEEDEEPPFLDDEWLFRFCSSLEQASGFEFEAFALDMQSMDPDQRYRSVKKCIEGNEELATRYGFEIREKLLQLSDPGHGDIANQQDPKVPQQDFEDDMNLDPDPHDLDDDELEARYQKDIDAAFKASLEDSQTQQRQLEEREQEQPSQLQPEDVHLEDDPHQRENDPLSYFHPVLNPTEDSRSDLDHRRNQRNWNEPATQGRKRKRKYSVVEEEEVQVQVQEKEQTEIEDGLEDLTLDEEDFLNGTKHAAETPTSEKRKTPDSRDEASLPPMKNNPLRSRWKKIPQFTDLPEGVKWRAISFFPYWRGDGSSNDKYLEELTDFVVICGGPWIRAYFLSDAGPQRVWDHKFEKQGLHPNEEQEDFRCMAWSVDLQDTPRVPILAVAGSGEMRAIHLFNGRTGEHKKSLYGHGKAILDLKFNPRHPNILASASLDSEIRIWDVSVPKIKNPHPRQAAPSTSVPQNKSKRNENLDIKPTHQPPHMFPFLAPHQLIAILAGEGRHRDGVCSIDWHPTAPLLLSGGLDASVKIWTVGPIEHLFTPHAASFSTSTYSKNKKSIGRSVDAEIIPKPIWTSKRVHIHWVDWVTWVSSSGIEQYSSILSHSPMFDPIEEPSDHSKTDDEDAEYDSRPKSKSKSKAQSSSAVFSITRRNADYPTTKLKFWTPPVTLWKPSFAYSQILQNGNQDPYIMPMGKEDETLYTCLKEIRTKGKDRFGQRPDVHFHWNSDHELTMNDDAIGMGRDEPNRDDSRDLLAVPILGEEESTTPGVAIYNLDELTQINLDGVNLTLTDEYLAFPGKEVLSTGFQQEGARWLGACGDGCAIWKRVASLVQN